MRTPFNNRHGLTGNAVAGTPVVFFGLDLAPAARKGFRGFAFRRTDHTEEDTVRLRGTKTFEKPNPIRPRAPRFPPANARSNPSDGPITA